LQHASDDVSEERVVMTCCKNNDGDLGPRGVWVRKNGLFSPVTEFDWESWDHPEDTDKQEQQVDEVALASIFENGKKRLKRADAIDGLIELTGRKKSTYYDALSPKGRFKKCLIQEGELLTFRP